ncbi:MAG TPA: glycine cleavage T C-terminal barrel domain-containing protein [Actinomycetaceae bacterium]|nr:glycine cleavage T C-terminal barrel domain-containing protein [Actinomycetaceae bacterium]
MLHGGMLEGAGPDAGVALHYGDPILEARALERGTALIDLSQLDVVAVTGPERLTWLHLFLSQHVATLPPGRSTESLILDPSGHVEHAAALIDDGATTWMITEAGRGEPLRAFLESMKFAARVETAVHEDLAVLGVLNSVSTPDALARLLDDDAVVVTWHDPWPETTGTSYGPPDDEHPAAEWDLALSVVPREGLAEIAERWTGIGGALAGMWAAEAARIAAWRPRFGREVDERTIPHELDWLRTAVHLEKGCYRGQETIARVVNLGKPPRRLVFLHLDGSAEELPSTGDPVFAGGRQAGHVTSAARHHELGPIALAVVRRSVDPAADLVVRVPVVVGQGGGVPTAGVAAGEQVGGVPAAGVAAGEQGCAERRTVDVAASQEEIVSAAGVSAATPTERPGQGLRGSGARNPNPGMGFGKR